VFLESEERARPWNSGPAKWLPAEDALSGHAGLYDGFRAVQFSSVQIADQEALLHLLQSQENA
jgi:hypothetical protein